MIQINLPNKNNIRIKTNISIKDISGVYKITNIINNKVYVGSSKNMYSRYVDHCYDLRNNKHLNSYLQSSYNQYGSDNFLFEVIEECNIDILIEKEQYWINYYESHINDKGYNLLQYAGNSTGFKHTEETKQYLSDIKKGQKQHINTYNAILKANIGRKHTDEERLKISITHKGRVFSQEHLTNMRKAQLGKSKPNKRRIIKTDNKFNIIAIYKTNEECSIAINMSQSNIRGICNGRIVQKRRYYLMYEHYPISWNRTKRITKLKFAI